MNQIALPLEPAAMANDEGYVRSPANAHVCDMLRAPESWPNGVLVLIGEAGSGKSRMADHVATLGARVCDDADGAGDEQLFHSWNLAKAAGAPLLMTARRPVGEWGTRLPDLRSRLATASVVEIGAPDDAMLTALIERHLMRHGIGIAPDALAFLAVRMERSYDGLQAFAEELADRAIERGRTVTRPMAARAIDRSEDLFAPTRMGRR